jgi:site-specific recombinase XerD
MGQRIDVNTAVDLFLLDGKAQGHTPSTQRFYSGRLRLVTDWLAERDVTHLDQFTPAQIRAYLASLRARELSDAYIHSHARALRTFFNFCVRDGLLDESPFDKIKMPRHRTEVRDVLRMADFKRLLDAATCERDRAILYLLLDTGLRASEALALNVGDVDGQTVTVRTDKGGRGRFVYIGAKTQKQLARYLAFERDNPHPHEPLFTSRKGGGRLTYFGMASIFRRLRLATGINVSPHMIRRTYAVESLRNGMNIYLLARLMGHADINTLRHYLKYVEKDIRQASERHGVVDNL